jgi:diguanylate cyclase (GGDEF)-like protein
VSTLRAWLRNQMVRARQDWRRAQRNATPLSMLLIDVDSCKRFNDLYGHYAGDDALIDVARCIARNARRAGNTTARYGGEEFPALLPATDAAGAMGIAGLTDQKSSRQSVGEYG